MNRQHCDVFEYARDAIFVADVKTGIILDCNKQAERLLGIPKKRIIGLHQTRIHPKDEAAAYRALFRAHAKRGSRVPCEGEIVQKNGNRIPVEINASIRKDHAGRSVVQGIFRDISSRKQAEEKLKNSEIRYRRLFETSQDGIILMDARTAIITDANPAFLKLVGLRAGNCIGKKIWETAPFAGSANLQKSFRNFIRVKKAHLGDTLIRTTSHKLIHAEITCTRYPIDGHALIQCNVRDITRRLLTEEALRESNQRFRGAFESAAIGMALVSLTGEWIQTNRSLCRIFGYREHELQRLRFQDLTYPDDLASSLDQLDRLLTGKASHVRFEKRYISKKKRIVWARLNVSLVRTAERMPSHFVTEIEDISEQKRAEESSKKFQLAVAGASDHIIITDPEANIVYANKAAERITGYAAKQMIGKNPGALWGGHMPKPFYEKMWHTIQLEKKIFRGEVTNMRKNGETYTAEISVSPIVDDAEHVLFFVGIERDITKAKEIDRIKSEFISVASHQLRTPLSTSGWYTEMLLSGDAGSVNPEQHRFLEEVLRANQRAVALINALLSVSRIDTGAMLSNPKPTALPDVVKSVLSALAPLARRNRITVHVDTPPNFPKLLIDPDMLGLVLQNLLSNAIKYSHENGIVRIAFSTHGENARIRVTDNGLGIPEHAKERIFTKFFRAENALKKDPDGTGLGLYIAKSATELAGGKIWFDSTENVGTTFVVQLPLHGKTAARTIKKT